MSQHRCARVALGARLGVVAAWLVVLVTSAKAGAQSSRHTFVDHLSSPAPPAAPASDAGEAPTPESYRALVLASTRLQAAMWRPGGWYFALW